MEATILVASYSLQVLGSGVGGLYVHVLVVRTCLSVVAKYDRCTNY
jgi:hypothetical protein